MSRPFLIFLIFFKKFPLLSVAIIRGGFKISLHEDDSFDKMGRMGL
jgi:hypothetical protein